MLRRSLAVVLASALTLAGCSSSPPAPPISPTHLEAYVLFLNDQRWAEVGYEEVSRPAYEPASTLTDSDWIDDAFQCFTSKGFEVEQNYYDFTYLSGLGQRPVDFAVARYSCLTRHPRLGALTPYLDEEQLVSLYEYYERQVRPCLRLAGERVGALAPPEEFVADSRFDPWAEVVATGGARAALMDRCPPVPRWLSLK